MSDKNKIHIELIKEWLEFDVDPVIRQRGLDYFTAGHIVNFQQDDEGKYIATVIGTNEYNVWFKIVDFEIYSSCNCPFSGDICKHQAAVAYAISEDYSPTTQTETVNTLLFPEEVRLQKILDQFTPEEIRKELFSILLSSEELFNNFTIAHEPLPEDRRSIRSIVLKALRTGADRSGFIDYWHAEDSARAVQEILNNANRLQNRGCVLHAFNVYRVTAIETTKALSRSDDSNGFLGAVVDDSIRLIHQCACLCPEEEKRILFSDLLKMIKNDVFSGWDWGWYLLQSLVVLIESEVQKKKVFAYLDEIESLDRRYSLPEYTMEKIQQIKHQVIIKTEGEDAGWAFVSDNIKLNHFRFLWIEYLISKQDFAEAMRVSKEGIALCESIPNRYAGIIHDYYKKLLAIAKVIDNQTMILQYETHLLIKFDDWPMYARIQQQYSEKDWQTVRESIWEKLKHKSYPSTLAKAFVHESEWDLLLDLCIQHPSIYSEHNRLLENKYPEHMANYYRGEAFKALNDTHNRNYYRVEAHKLTKLIKLGFPELFTRTIEDLCSMYPARRAMIEELTKVKTS